MPSILNLPSGHCGPEVPFCVRQSLSDNAHHTPGICRDYTKALWVIHECKYRQHTESAWQGAYHTYPSVILALRGPFVVTGT